MDLLSYSKIYLSPIITLLLITGGTLVGWYMVSLFVFRRKNKQIPGLKNPGTNSGHIPEIQAAGSLHQFLTNLHGQFGPVVSFWLGQHQVVSTANHHCFKQQQHLFNRPKELFTDFKPIIGAQSIQYLNDEEGKRIRRELDFCFSHDACSSYLHIFVQVAEELALEWNKVGPSEPVALNKCMLSIGLKGVLRSCFGNFFTSNDACYRFQENYDRTFRALDHSLWKEDQEETRKEEFRQGKEEMYSLVREIMAERRKVQGGEELLVDKIMAVSSSDEQALHIAITYIIGGYHTTGVCMTWLLYYLCKHPDWQRRIREEYDAVLGTDQEMSPAALSDLVITKNVIDETMRCCQLAPYAARVSDEDLDICGNRISKSTPIIQSLGLACHNEEVWHMPKKFDPSRFEKMSSDSLACPFFGFAGKRKCPAYRFAYAEMLSFMSVLLTQFKVSLEDADQVVTPVCGLVLSPAEEIYVFVESLI